MEEEHDRAVVRTVEVLRVQRSRSKRGNVSGRIVRHVVVVLFRVSLREAALLEQKKDHVHGGHALQSAATKLQQR